MNEQERNNLKRLLWLGNVYPFFPERPVSDLQQGYQRWLKHKQQFKAAYSRITLAQLQQDLNNQMTGAIDAGMILTFHYGPYRLLPRYLLARGYEVTLLLSTDVLERESEQYRKELDAAGMCPDRLECLDAHDPLVLRKICRAAARQRVVLVFLDANESLAKHADQDQEAKVRIDFAAHYFYWRINILKIAQRFGISVAVTHMERKGNDDLQSWHMREPQQVLIPEDQHRPDAISRACAVLQQTFQAMIEQDWTAWENWTLLHRYMPAKAPEIATANDALGSWFIPFTWRDKAYLFDLSTKGFYELSCKNK